MLGRKKTIKFYEDFYLDDGMSQPLVVRVEWDGLRPQIKIVERKK